MRLFSKLFLIMVAFGALGLGLLALRQQRYEVSNEISRAHNRIVEQERAQWRMRAEVARRSDPVHIRTYASKLKLELTPAGESSVLSATPAEGALGEHIVAEVASSEVAMKRSTATVSGATEKVAKSSTTKAPARQVSATKKASGFKSSPTGNAKAGTRDR
ncbi:MAG: hypothetical protein DWH86_02895 [Planctomycetota bacterium]|nr:MAG: hypothetical protein DWH86_02895 [Planctomycetota bacterium]